MNFTNDNFVQRRLKSQSKNSRAIMESRVAQQQASANVAEAIGVVGESVSNVAVSTCDMFSTLITEIDKKADKGARENV